MTRFTVRVLATVAVLPLVMSLVPASARAAPTRDKGREYIAMLIAPITGPYGASQTKKLENSAAISQLYYVGEASCTNDVMAPETLDDLDAAYRTLPVTFGTKENPKDPIGDARQAVFGTPKLTNEVRHQLCDSLELRNKFYDTARDLIIKYGQQIKPDFADVDQDLMDDIWASRIGAWGTVLKPWLPISLQVDG